MGVVSDPQKKKIMQELEQVNAGLGTPAKHVIKKAREKCGLNG